ncbi:hypothetical protein EJV46_04005 [Roseococcus sp. SYP-B2431]|uniref:hypothetical protein n=1 Tax=Roseococcus sp. SYP-B2431 TaxID=2496640 RepID=UPI00103D1FF5|nr:hypothetical protein [Roseococcus sp. SYP-B2431]TCH99841.1 hypothetical protein EJV46_04005 [Roseococcus sp. SYP-B2431]
MPRAAALLLPVLLLAACSNTPLIPPARPGDAVRTNPQVAQACRDQTARRIERQDRGQLMREDERDSRLGSETVFASQAMQTDRLGRQFQFSREVDDCIRANTQQGMPRPAAAPAPDSSAPPPPARRPRS